MPVGGGSASGQVRFLQASSILTSLSVLCRYKIKGVSICISAKSGRSPRDGETVGKQQLKAKRTERKRARTRDTGHVLDSSWIISKPRASAQASCKTLSVASQNAAAIRCRPRLCSRLRLSAKRSVFTRQESDLYPFRLIHYSTMLKDWGSLRLT